MTTNKYHQRYAEICVALNNLASEVLGEGKSRTDYGKSCVEMRQSIFIDSLSASEHYKNRMSIVRD